jgi:hypothetical protein
MMSSSIAMGSLSLVPALTNDRVRHMRIGGMDGVV